jgi:AmmeMemoRadiSam system protein B
VIDCFESGGESGKVQEEVMRPKLRPVEMRWVRQAGRPLLMLRDALGLNSQPLFVPQALAPLLELCDGSRDIGGLRASLEVRAGIRLMPSAVEHFLAQLDEALLLDNERSAQARRAALEEFRGAPYRTPVLAGEGYPEDSKALEGLLGGHMASSGAAEAASNSAEVRGLVSPHIDFQRGAAVYARVWAEAREAAQGAELVVILGTDHNAGEAVLTLTHQRYATPWGPLPTASEVVDALAEGMGGEAFRDELHHRREHSIELALVWLHYLLGDRQCQVLPILCGPFERLVGGDPNGEARLSAAVEVLRGEVAKRRALVVAAGDLAHVGPAFGDAHPVDLLGRARLTAADEELLRAISSGEAEALLQTAGEQGDRWRVCGLPPMYLALQILEGAQGEVVGYEQCPADAQGGSLVSICGVIFR